MKPKAPNEHEDGLLEYLEDIIGTAELKPEIAEAAEKLETLQDERVLLLGRLRITEGKVKALEEQKAAAEEHIRLKNELARAHSLLLQFYLWVHFKEETKLKEGLVRAFSVPASGGRRLIFCLSVSSKVNSRRYAMRMRKSWRSTRISRSGTTTSRSWLRFVGSAFRDLVSVDC